MGIADDIAASILSGEPAAAPSVVDDVVARILADEQPPSEEPGFFARIGGRLAERGEQLQEITAAPPETTVESLEKGLQVLGTGAGAALDIGGEVISTGFGLLSQAVSAVTPDFIEDPIVSKVGDAFEAIVGTEVAQAGLQAAGQGIEAYQAWAEEHPRAAKDVAALANIALVAAPVKVRPRAAPTPSVVGRAAEAVGAAAETQVATVRTSFIEGLIRPKSTKKVREAEIQRTGESGIIGGRTVTLSPTEQAIAKTVNDIEGVTSQNTLLQNLNAVQAANDVEAQSLRETLRTSKNKIPRGEIKASMDDVLTEFSDSLLLVGDAAKTGERTVRRARAFMQANPNTPAGVFRARQQFDAWVKTQRPKIFDPSTESALSIAVRETRQAMNEIVAKNAPAANVRASLSRQSNMFDAVENIGAKAADEAGTAIGRLSQRISEVTGLKGQLPKVAGAIALTGGTVAAPQLAAGAAAVAAIGFVGNKLIFSPATKRGVAKLLQQSEKAIQKATSQGNTDLVKQLRTDRIAVIEILRNSTTAEEK